MQFESLLVSEVEVAVPTVLISVSVNDSAPSVGTNTMVVEKESRLTEISLPFFPLGQT